VYPENAALDVQRARHDDRVDVFHVEEAPVIVKRLNAGRHPFGFVATSRVNVGDGDELGVRSSHHLFEQFCPRPPTPIIPRERDHWHRALAKVDRQALPPSPRHSAL